MSFSGAHRENLLKAQEAAASFAHRAADDTRRIREIVEKELAAKDAELARLREENKRLKKSWGEYEVLPHGTYVGLKEENKRLRGLLERWVKEITGIECWSDDCPELRPLVDATKAALAGKKEG